MQDVENLVKTTMGEIEKMLTAKTVVGDPIVIDGKTIIPLLSVGFAFGAGGGTGKAGEKMTQEGTGGGTGGGAGIRPIGVIVSDENGVRIEPIKAGMGAALEKIAEKAIPMMMKRGEKGQQGQAQEESSAK